MTSPHGSVVELDALVIGAGFSGLYALHRLRNVAGLNVRAVEASAGVGGTWFTNRYPGARCDTESFVYCYSFSRELREEWRWSSKYPAQAELLAYFDHVADRFDLRSSIDLETKVLGATYDEERHRWYVDTDRGTYECQYLVSAMGVLSAVPYTPTLPGIEDFEGTWVHAGSWPAAGLDLTEKRVAVIGTGSTGVQTAPVVAQQAEHLYVVQRSPQYTIPARHAEIDDVTFAAIQDDFEEIWRIARTSAGGFPWQHNGLSALEATEDELNRTLEDLWAEGGLKFFFGSYRDLVVDLAANERVAAFVRSKIAERVEDPHLAAKLIPTDHPFGARRPIVDTGYFEMFARENVTLLDLREEPLIGATASGLRTKAGDYDVDVIIFATGFDAVTGPFLRLDIRGRAGESIQQHWAETPSSYLGLMINGFPNLFTITGPGSTFGNHAVTMELHVEWIANCIEHMRRLGIDAIEPTRSAEEAWGEDLQAQVEQTVVAKGSSWWSGENIPGKKRRPLFSVASHKHYRRVCDEVAAGGYVDFKKYVGPDRSDATHRSDHLEALT